MNNNDNFQIISECLKANAKKADNKSLEYNRSKNENSINYAYAYGVFFARLEYALMNLNLTEKQLAELQASLNV